MLRRSSHFKGHCSFCFQRDLTSPHAGNLRRRPADTHRKDNSANVFEREDDAEDAIRDAMSWGSGEEHGARKASFHSWMMRATFSAACNAHCSCSCSVVLRPAQYVYRTEHMCNGTALGAPPSISIVRLRPSQSYSSVLGACFGHNMRESVFCRCTKNLNWSMMMIRSEERQASLSSENFKR